MQEKEDINGDWEVIEGHEFAKTGYMMHLYVISDQKEVK